MTVACRGIYRELGPEPLPLAPRQARIKQGFGKENKEEKTWHHQN